MNHSKSKIHEMNELVQNYFNGESVKSICETSSISQSTLYYWIGNLADVKKKYISACSTGTTLR